VLRRILRFTSLLALALAVGLAWVLAQLGTPVWLAVVVGALLPLAIHAVPLAFEFTTGAIIDRRPIARLNAIDAVRLWWTESWRSFTAFTIDQAWRADFPERSIVHDRLRPTVLLVHGYVCNRGVWLPWIDRLPAHWNVATISLEPVYASIQTYADVLDRAVKQLRANSGADRITLVCHSMGGLAARAYLRAHQHDSVERVITIDTPHYGTVFARFGHGTNTREMQRASEYLDQLAAIDEPVEFICFASQHDNLVVPRQSQILKGAEAVWFERIGHLATTANDDVLAKLIEVIERPMAAKCSLQVAAA
jgi:triacylglycerol lipase